MQLFGLILTSVFVGMKVVSTVFMAMEIFDEQC